MLSVANALVLGLFQTPAQAADAAGALHTLGIGREDLSVVARTHADGQALAERMDATAGVDLEDSRPAARLGELAGRVLATVALVMPGIGPIVAAGPLSAELGEMAGHAAGSLASVLTSAGLLRERAEALQHEVAKGAVLLGAHVAETDAGHVRDTLAAAGATQVETLASR